MIYTFIHLVRSNIINLLKYDIPYELLLDVQGYDVAYAVYGDAEDYVEQTSEWMRQFAKKQFTYPFYLHFESYYDTVDDILAETDLVMHYKPSGRTVLTQIGRNCFQAEVPAFTVEIRQEADLHKAFERWFTYAFDNHLWALTQHKSVMYVDGFPRLTLKPNEIILVAEHDAYGFTVLTNRADLQQEETLRSLLENALDREV